MSNRTTLRMAVSIMNCGSFSGRADRKSTIASLVIKLSSFDSSSRIFLSSSSMASSSSSIRFFVVEVASPSSTAFSKFVRAFCFWVLSSLRRLRIDLSRICLRRISKTELAIRSICSEERNRSFDARITKFSISSFRTDFLRQPLRSFFRLAHL